VNYSHQGRVDSNAGWARHIGVTSTALMRFLRKGHTISDAIAYYRNKKPPQHRTYYIRKRCRKCRRLFSARVAGGRQQSYCSRACAGLTKVERSHRCQGCERLFTYTGRMNRRYCSGACANRHRSLGLGGVQIAGVHFTFTELAEVSGRPAKLIRDRSEWHNPITALTATRSQLAQWASLRRRMGAP
jgi:hypothetical protein